MAGESFRLGSRGKFEGDVLVTTCNIVVSIPLRGRVVIVQGFAENRVRLIPLDSGRSRAYVGEASVP